MSIFLRQFKLRPLYILVINHPICNSLIFPACGVRTFTSRGAIHAQSPGVANPRSSNPESQAINVSRGKESRHDDSPDSKSVQSPISSRFGATSEAHEGEEPTATTEKVHNDSNKPASKKRQNVKEAGKRPMGLEDGK